MERINVRVDKRVKHELEAEARRRGVSSSELVRTAVKEYLKGRPRQESCLDIARRIGLVGCVKGLPRDLSTNHGHFEGFGRD